MANEKSAARHRDVVLQVLTETEADENERPEAESWSKEDPGKNRHAQRRHDVGHTHEEVRHALSDVLRMDSPNPGTRERLRQVFCKLLRPETEDIERREEKQEAECEPHDERDPEPLNFGDHRFKYLPMQSSLRGPQCSL